MTKLTIDLKNGLLEVEGEEEFVRGIYADYKDVLAMVSARAADSKDATPAVLTMDTTKKPESGGAQKTRTRSKGKKESHKVVGSLSLAPAGKKSFRDFVKEKMPGSGMEMNAVAVYYLQKTLEVTGITPDHIYSCYKDVDRKVPIALIQNLWDTASLKSWVDTSDMASIRITTAGENLVEHDLPRKKAGVAK